MSAPGAASFGEALRSAEAAPPQRRAVNMPMTIEVIEALGWLGFQAIAVTVREVAAFEGWPDAETAAERLEWRRAERWPNTKMIMATFEVLPR